MACTSHKLSRHMSSFEWCSIREISTSGRRCAGRCSFTRSCRWLGTSIPIRRLNLSLRARKQGVGLSQIYYYYYYYRYIYYYYYHYHYYHYHYHYYYYYYY